MLVCSQTVETSDFVRIYHIPAELAATVEKYQADCFSQRLWIEDGGELVHPMRIQQRRMCTVPGEVVADFIRTMKRLRCQQGKRSCLLCRRQLPLRWMVILCIVCGHKLVGGAGVETLTLKDIEIIYFLHQLVQNIHARRLRRDCSILFVEVDPIMEERLRLVIAENETAKHWWLLDFIPGVDSIVNVEPLGGAPLLFPVEGAHGCPSRLSESITSGNLRSSRSATILP